MNKQTRFSSVGALLLIVIAIAVVVYSEQKTDGSSDAGNQNASLLIRDYSPSIGNKNAKVTIVEFFDPACETCKTFHPIVKRLMSRNPGRIRLVLRYTPFHKGSDYVAKFLEATRLQNKFWQTLEATYEAQPLWASHNNPQPEKLWALLDYVGLDLIRLRRDMHSSIIEKRIQQDIEDARKLQVTKTPGFFVNGKPLVRFGRKELQQLVESEIRNNYSN